MHQIRFIAVATCAVLLLSGCNKKAQDSYGLGGAGVASEARVMLTAAPAFGAANQATRRSGTLAYEHMVSIEFSKELLPTRLREIESACAADKKFDCTILEVSISSNEDIPSGNIRMRLAPGGVDPIIGLAGKDGKMAARNTRAEDLAQPVADTERELGLMTVHRDRLAEFMKSKELKVEQLITVSRELATVQAQIEALSTTHANLRRRIDTELLTISLSLPRQDYAAEQSPVLDAFRSFGTDFKQAIAQVIGFVAVLLPWLVIIVPGLILLRMLWRWIGRWVSRRERRAAPAA